MDFFNNSEIKYPEKLEILDNFFLLIKKFHDKNPRTFYIQLEGIDKKKRHEQAQYTQKDIFSIVDSYLSPELIKLKNVLPYGYKDLRKDLIEKQVKRVNYKVKDGKGEYAFNYDIKGFEKISFHQISKCSPLHQVCDKSLGPRMLYRNIKSGIKEFSPENEEKIMKMCKSTFGDAISVLPLLQEKNILFATGKVSSNRQF